MGGTLCRIATRIRYCSAYTYPAKCTFLVHPREVKWKKHDDLSLSKYATKSSSACTTIDNSAESHSLACIHNTSARCLLLLKILECEEAPVANCRAPLKKDKWYWHQSHGDESECTCSPGDAEIAIHCIRISPTRKEGRSLAVMGKEAYFEL